MKTTTKTSLKNIPAELVTALKVEGCLKRSCRLVVVSEDGFAVQAHNTQWDGGTRNYHYGFSFGGDTLFAIHTAEGGSIVLNEGCAVVVASHFCGKEYDPTIYVRNADLAAFMGHPAPDGMPAEIAADWLTHEAEKASPREAKKIMTAVALIRTFTGLVTA